MSNAKEIWSNHSFNEFTAPYTMKFMGQVLNSIQWDYLRDVHFGVKKRFNVQGGDGSIRYKVGGDQFQKVGGAGSRQGRQIQK